jgi:predicted ABC-type ATPase
MKRSGRKSAAQTPAPKKERVYGSKKNPIGSAASSSSAKEIVLSENIVESLKQKADDYNSKHPTNKVSVATLKAVMRRGMGAYSKSHRPTITGGAPNSRTAWGFARVNKFLKKKGGAEVKKAYVQDDDLLEMGGSLGKEITCVKCGWHWNTSDSQEYDKYVCHKCGFDNRTFYDSDPVGRLAKGMSLNDIAEHHGIDVSELKPELELGIKTEMEHTYDKNIAKAIAYDHLFEDPQYYTHLVQMEMKVEGQKLEGYYASGGDLVDGSCKAVDANGEALTDRESLEMMTKCLENLPQTKTMHFDPVKNDYDPERKKLHRKIIYEFKKDLICVDNSNPIAILMGGSPASGKSTFLKKYAPYLLKTEILKIDADEIRAKLPEYEGYNATQTHLETKDIVNTLLSDRNIGIPCLFDVIYDGTMNSTKSYLPLINLLKSLGYKVFIVYIDNVPKDVVINRSIERYKKSGRFVPLEVIDDFFNKGTEALEKLKSQVDGYMVVDGSDNQYRVIERGGMRLPKNRNYSKIGEPIEIKEEEVVRELKRGGEINPDNPQIKSVMTHKAGAAGGLLVGRRHSEGGIKAINKSTNSPLEMEGGEVVITRDAVSDDTKREFEGQMLTNRQILSKINESGGGVSFADGGDVPDKCSCSGKSYNFGGKVLPDVEIVNNIISGTRKSIGIQFPELPVSEAMDKLFSGFYKMDEGGQIYAEGGMIRLVNKRVPSFKAYTAVHTDLHGMAAKKSYKEHLKSKYGVEFQNLPQRIQVGLLLGNQKLVDNYINS